jgi:YcaO-like protein with predicted kinase domain
MMTRKELRSQSAQYLNGLSRDELFDRFTITRIGRIDGLDTIGVPVYSGCRPAAKVISVSAGKSRSASMARAGAIAEAIEFATFESPVGEFHVEQFVEQLELPTGLDSKWTPDIPIAVEQVNHYASGEERLLPSDLIWITKRHGKERHFMTSSNGQAMGATFEDAFCQGLCECVERDQFVLRRLSLQKLGIYPPRIALPLCASSPGGATSSDTLTSLWDRCRAASLKLYLFYCTVDIPIPVYWSLLFDPSGYASFAGYGAHVSHLVAAERAILEAIQSRAVFIAGARDDIERRKFMSLSQEEIRSSISEIESLPVHLFPQESPLALSTEEELALVVKRLGTWRDHIYFKHIDLGDLHLVKSIILGLECPIHDRDGGKWRSMRWDKLRELFMSVPHFTV